MKVAVILNENELQRFGHPNIVPYFQSLFANDPIKYSFVPFTNVNIDDLFSNGKKSLFIFDSIYISTNACNDIDILSKLNQEKLLIEEFIKEHHGVFVGYQKKISISNDPDTGFLPEIYNYMVVRKEKEYERWMKENDPDRLRIEGIPTREKASNSGCISISSNNHDDVVLNYPRKIDASLIEKTCKDEKNGFRAHVYRAVIRPQLLGAYDTLLCDDSYEEIRPLLCKCVSGNDERIVITTIAFDWERQNDILYNIIKYITEGTPNIALITDLGNTDGDFRYLMSNMTLNKITHCVLSPQWLNNALESDEDYISKMVKCYVFSSSFSRDVVDKFWNKYKVLRAIKVYYFEKKQDDGDQVLLEYSNISSISSNINNIYLWVNSQYLGGMFKGSFWTTVDTLMMLKDLNLDYESYLQGVFKDIFDNHYYKDNDGSYDGLIGCTVGLLELLIVFQNDLVTIYKDIDDNINKTLLWVLQKAKYVSVFEQISIVNVVYRLDLLSSLSEQQLNWIEEICSDIVLSNDFNSMSENELCRSIEYCLNRGNQYEFYFNLLLDQQNDFGAWVSIGRTSNVINFLVSKYDLLCKDLNETQISQLQSCIELGIVYLSAEYDGEKSCWNNDFLATVKATRAIGSYNAKFKYATKDFSETIRDQSKEITRQELTSYAIDTISKQRLTINNLNNEYRLTIRNAKDEYSALLQQKHNCDTEIEIKNKEISNLKARIKKHGKIIAFLFCFSLILIILVLLRYEAYVGVFKEIVSFFDIKDIITNSVSSLVLLFLGGIGTFYMLKFSEGRNNRKPRN